MVNVEENKKLNQELEALYSRVTDEFLVEYKKAFSEDTNPPKRLIEFGIVDVENYDAENGILIILKEANGWQNEGFENGDMYTDFVRDVIDKGRDINDGREKSERVQMNMWYNLGRWITAIKEPQRPTDEIAEMYDEALTALESVAITNINKIRGYASSGKEYWEIAKSEVAIQTIKEEINILQPKIILCGGTAYSLGYDYLDGLRKNNCKVLDMWHPAARKSKVEMIDEVKRQMCEVGQ